MDSPDTFDFWYALKNTRISRLPSSHLETFGNTVINYHLVSELMDTVQRVRIREGRVTALRPQIITPTQMDNAFLEGFGADAAEYADWLRKNEADLRILQYGFSIKKEETSNEVVTGTVEDVAERVGSKVKDADDPLGAVVVGVDKPWEVCILKMMVDIIQGSVAHNVKMLQQHMAFDVHDRKTGDVHAQLESDFDRAAHNPSLIPMLSKKLQKLGLFEDYQDRFFSLVQKHRR